MRCTLAGGHGRDASQTHYEVLGITTAASDREIKAAYRRLALRLHPDVNPDDPVGAQAKFTRCNLAYETLSDAPRRRAYDRELAMQVCSPCVN
jgi:molecular chaperone DnaJ